jgi:hypothetical protein
VHERAGEQQAGDGADETAGEPGRGAEAEVVAQDDGAG